jgi:replicative DNA helicase
MSGTFAPGAPAPKKNPWIHVSETFDLAIDTMEKRKTGEVQSIKTPWESFNDAGMDGIEWNSMVVIGARPGQGKTLVADMITREAFKLNFGQDFAVLKLQFEMLGRTTAMRELSAELRRSVKYLNSAEKVGGVVQKVSEADITKAKHYALTQKFREEYIIETAMTPAGIEKAVRDFAKFIGKPFIITLDHSMLVVKDASEKDKLETLQNLGAMMTKLKRQLPIIWIVLTQLNRSIDDASRQEKAGSHSNYPNEADVFGSDALLQHTDILVAINRPSRYNLAIYGPEQFEVTSRELLAFHFLKVRSGTPRISFFLSEFEKMSIRECPPPPRKMKSKFTPSSS